MSKTFDEHQSEWTQAFLDAGHVFKRQDPDPEFDGPEGPPIDWFAVSHDIHNGPECVRCGWSCCQHCTTKDRIPQCTAQIPDAMLSARTGDADG